MCVYFKLSTSLQFLLIFRRAAAGELQEESGLLALARLSEIDVSTQGVMGAKDFFEAKVCNNITPCTLAVRLDFDFVLSSFNAYHDLCSE